MKFFRRFLPPPPPPPVEAVETEEQISQAEAQSLIESVDVVGIATTLGDLQDEIANVNTPAKNHFKPWWLLVAVVVFVIIGIGTFTGVRRLTEVDENTRAISEACEIRNEALAVINGKFNQLNVLFDASLATPRPPDQPPPSAEILRLYAEFKKPIPLKDCKESP